MIGVLAAVALGATGAGAADWKAFAAGAAAYEVNAAVADPDRPASMRTMVSEVAGDYRNAAQDLMRKRAKVSAKAAARSVADEIARRTAEYRPKARTEVERVIDLCPQLPESE